MISIVERVARAICVAAGLDPDRKGTNYEFHWQDFSEEARAAIAAMREPTGTMIEAGINADHTLESICGRPGYEESCANIFVAMIGKALSE